MVLNWFGYKPTFISGQPKQTPNVVFTQLYDAYHLKSSKRNAIVKRKCAIHR